MRKLYLRIYLALLASLALFALAAGLLWRTLGEPRGDELTAAVARNLLPPASAAGAEQQAALERLTRGARIDLALFAADGARVAAVGESVPPPEREGWQGVRGGGVWVTRLEDGRWLVVRPPHYRRGPAFGLAVLALLSLAIGVGAYPVVRRLTKRLERLQAGVEALGAGTLSARVKVEGKDEVARLAESFNLAAARIEKLVGAHKSLLASASHELRTPLARIRMALELGKDRQEIERNIAELDALIDEILLMSRLDALQALEHEEEVDLLALAAEECARYDAELDGGPVALHGDPRLLRRMLRNLLENARRHGSPPTKISLLKTGKEIELRVCDAGPGVAEAERDRIFERFYRGLGLSLVRQIARGHGGEARCEGNCFVVVLPTPA